MKFLLMVIYVIAFLALATQCFSEENLKFHDHDNSCSLGCACGWDVFQPKDSVQLGKAVDLKDGEDEIIFTKSILLKTGSRISFRLKEISTEKVSFNGYNFCLGSFNKGVDYSIPKHYVIGVNEKIIKEGDFENTTDGQSVIFENVDVRNGDTIWIDFKDSYDPQKEMAVTFISPAGAH